MTDQLNYGTFNEGHAYEVVYRDRDTGMATRITGVAAPSILRPGGWIIEGTGTDDGCTIRLEPVVTHPDAGPPATPWRARHQYDCCDNNGGSFSDGNPFNRPEPPPMVSWEYGTPCPRCTWLRVMVRPVDGATVCNHCGLERGDGGDDCADGLLDPEHIPVDMTGMGGECSCGCGRLSP